jgi:polyisoprenoid-binding protein YceI
LIAYGYGGDKAPPLAAGDSSRVTFEFNLQGDVSAGKFTDSTVELTLDSINPVASSLRAVVNTASVASGNSQIDTTLLGSDWFAASNHPEAVFESTKLLPDGDNRYRVTGNLQIRGVVRALEFPMQLVQREGKRMATGSFTVSRLDFGLGADSEPDDETVGLAVTVTFTFELR